MRLYPPSCFFHWEKPCGTLVVAFFFLAVCAAEAGTWSSRQWVNDGDLPQTTPGSVTHAIAFGVEPDPPAPAPFQITDKISGENWTVWRMPEHTVSVGVSRRGEKILEGVKVDGEGDALVRGRLTPKGGGKKRGASETAGLALELSGLEAGRKYTLAIFGLGFIHHSSPGGFLMKAVASDAPDQPEILKSQTKAKGGTQFWVYEYTAPADGQITVSFENGAEQGDIGTMRICAFLNYRVE